MGQCASGVKAKAKFIMIEPVSPAALNDGRVVVTGYCNDRIQIFE